MLLASTELAPGCHSTRAGTHLRVYLEPKTPYVHIGSPLLLHFLFLSSPFVTNRLEIQTWIVSIAINYNIWKRQKSKVEVFIYTKLCNEHTYRPKTNHSIPNWSLKAYSRATPKKVCYTSMSCWSPHYSTHSSQFLRYVFSRHFPTSLLQNPQRTVSVWTLDCLFARDVTTEGFRFEPVKDDENTVSGCEKYQVSAWG